LQHLDQEAGVHSHLVADVAVGEKGIGFLLLDIEVPQEGSVVQVIENADHGIQTMPVRTICPCARAKSDESYFTKEPLKPVKFE
jgi:hypothetical protein